MAAAILKGQRQNLQKFETVDGLCTSRATLVQPPWHCTWLKRPPRTAEALTISALFNSPLAATLFGYWKPTRSGGYARTVGVKHAREGEL